MEILASRRTSPQVARSGSSEIARVRKTRASNSRPSCSARLGHLHRVANGLVPIVEFLVASSKPIDFGLLAASLGGSSRLPVFLRQLGEPVKGRQIGRIGRDQAFQLPPFGFDITAAGTASQAPADGSGPGSTRLLAGASGPARTTSTGWSRCPRRSQARQTGTSSGRRLRQASSHRSASS